LGRPGPRVSIIESPRTAMVTIGFSPPTLGKGVGVIDSDGVGAGNGAEVVLVPRTVGDEGVVGMR